MNSCIKALAFGAAALCVLQAGAVEFKSRSGSDIRVPEKVRTAVPPKGDIVNYNKKSVGTWLFGGMYLSLYEDEFPATVIWGNDNKVYFRNILSTFPYETYAEGVYSDGVITVPTGQMVAEEEGADYAYNLGVFRTVPDGDDAVYFELDEDIESITFTVDADGTITLELPCDPFDGVNPPEYVMGFYFSDNYDFSGYCDFSQVYTKLDLELVTIPEDAEIMQYAYVDEFSYASIVEVAEYEGYLYIRGLNSMLPEATIKAKIEGDKAIVAQNEYLGVYFDMYYIFTKVLLDNPDYDEEDDESMPFIFAPSSEGFVLKLDRDGRRIYADTEGVYLSYHCDAEDFLNSLGLYGIFELKYQESFAGVPANPVDLEYHEEWVDMQGWNDFFFTISNFSKDGTLLDVEKLYYRVFVDGEPVVFYQHVGENLLGDEAVLYPDVPVKVELLPFLFNNNEDIFKFSLNAFDVGIYKFVEETIGVQSVYYFNDVFTCSDIVTLNLETGEITATPDTGVKTPEAEGEIVAITYYTVDGRPLSGPLKGICIRVDTYSNGLQTAKKVIL